MLISSLHLTPSSQEVFIVSPPPISAVCSGYFYPIGRLCVVISSRAASDINMNLLPRLPFTLPLSLRPECLHVDRVTSHPIFSPLGPVPVNSLLLYILLAGWVSNSFDLSGLPRLPSGSSYSLASLTLNSSRGHEMPMRCDTNKRMKRIALIRFVSLSLLHSHAFNYLN